jgi:hypothetical protein
MIGKWHYFVSSVRKPAGLGGMKLVVFARLIPDFCSAIH